MEFDRRLVALCDCPVYDIRNTPDIHKECHGFLTFNPHPLIAAEDDKVLAHELCHRLSGKKDYDLFNTACLARDSNTLFSTVLNILTDWYDERRNEGFSDFVFRMVEKLHNELPMKATKIEELDKLIDVYNKMLPIPEGGVAFGRKIEGVEDLIIIADLIVEKVISRNANATSVARFIKDFSKLVGSDVVNRHLSGSNYFRTVAKYDSIISELAKLWKRNKYAWLNNYYGEINWKNLPGLLLGSKMSLPVFQILSKRIVDRQTFLVVDRSGSTENFRQEIMDTAVIITESFRMCRVPITVIDVGFSNSVTGGPNKNLNLSWFEPASDGGTPLGRRCGVIEGADENSFLIIITDGLPDSMPELISVLHRFPGHYLTFAIGNSYYDYYNKIRNVIPVAPHTIIKELMRFETDMS